MLPCYLPSCRLGVVYTIFVTHPLHCPRWEHFAPGLNTILGEVRIVLLKPAPKGRATHSCSVCEVGFIHTFHRSSYLTTDYWQLTTVFYLLFPLSIVRGLLSFFSLQNYEKILIFANLLLFIFSDCFSAFQRLGKMSYLCSAFRKALVS